MNIIIFKVSLFGNFRQYKADTKTIMPWTQELDSVGIDFLPGICKQQMTAVPVGQFTVNNLGIGENRMKFVAPDDKVTVRILSERVDVEFSFDETEEIEAISKKLATATNIMEKVSELMDGAKGNRMAYFVDGVISEDEYGNMGEFLKQNNLGICIPGASPDYDEWSHRFNSRAELEVGEDKKELCNLLFTAEKGVMNNTSLQNGEIRSIKGLRITADINTLSENFGNRFETADFEPFLKNADKMYQGAIEQIMQSKGGEA